MTAMLSEIKYRTGIMEVYSLGPIASVSAALRLVMSSDILRNCTCWEQQSPTPFIRLPAVEDS